MNQLLESGFEPAGHWLLENDKLKLELTRHSTQKNILYALVCDGQIKYVGKTIQTLAARMSGYKNPGQTQTTNINNNRRIKEHLANGAAVEVFALPDSGLLHYGQFHLNLAAALEDDIIRVVSPERNGGAIEGAGNLPVTTMEPEPEPAITQTFTFTLQPTYYKTGFFNIGIAAEKYLGADSEMIELFLGDRSQPVLGTINRRANSNGTPRIMGGTELRNWFNENAAVMDDILVGVLSPTSIQLHVNKATS